MINKIPHQILWNYAVPFNNGVPQIKKQKVDFFCTYCQQHDILCVYNSVWTGEQSYEIAFSNIEKESAVIISTYRISNKDNDNKVFRDGYLELKKRVNPSKIYCYGPAQKVMAEDIANGIVEFIPTRNRIVEKELQEKSGIQELFFDCV